MGDLAQLEIDALYADKILEIGKLSEPQDILWKNMSGNQGIYIFRRYMMNFFGVLIILFVSSPTVVFSKLKD
jgi:hypothetical protein